MAFAISLRRKETSIPWGFRMDGGSEFGSPLFIQKVNNKSLAEKYGLNVGDAILQIGHKPTQGMTHDNAKMEIIRSGNELDFVVQRNAVTVTAPTPHYETTVTSDPQDHHTEHYPDMIVVHEHSPWKASLAQNPNVQSKSFKVIQQQLSSHAK